MHIPELPPCARGKAVPSASSVTESPGVPQPLDLVQSWAWCNHPLQNLMSPLTLFWRFRALGWGEWEELPAGCPLFCRQFVEEIARKGSCSELK